MPFLKRLRVVSRFSTPSTARSYTRASISMLKQAVQQCSPPALPSAATKTRKPLQPNLSLNSQKSFTAKKRKLERTVSSSGGLGALHTTTGFGDENAFDDIPNGPSVTYPSLPNATSNVSYPPLPPSDSPSLPWSSSPPEHFQPPPCKRRTIPWAAEHETNPASVPPPIDQARNSSSYLWNGHAGATKTKRNQTRKIGKLDQIPFAQNEVPEPRTSTIEPVKNFLLSNEQKAILTAVVDKGKSIFFTGSAGTGKSVLMRSIIKKLRDRYIKEPDRLAVTASTGLAAVNIDGTTLHSFAGIGLGKEPATELVKKIKRNPKTRQRWARTKVLIIDEVSMIDGDLFDKLEQIARILRGNGSPFGGIQLVVTGDFFQLPPVAEKERVAKFSFDSVTWNTCIEHTILLTDVFRQKDATFAAMLNEMRLGRLTPASIQSFRKLSRALNFADDLEATELFPTRGEVEHANNNKMKMLSGETFVYPAEDSGISDLQTRERMLNNFMAPKELQLKKGAQVMLIKNVDSDLVNGTLGKVVCFSDADLLAYRKEHEAEYEAAYVEGGEGSEARKLREKIHAAVYKNGAVARGKLYPVVAFQLADGTTRQLMVKPEEWKSELPNGEIQAKRLQVPLILAWALSIHKAQGQTLKRVKVDLGRVFEKGQAYVALSRATSQEGLQVLRFDARKVMVHPRVVEFYDNLAGFSQLQGAKNPQSQQTEAARVTGESDGQSLLDGGDEFGSDTYDAEEVEKLMQRIE